MTRRTFLTWLAATPLLTPLMVSSAPAQVADERCCDDCGRARPPTCDFDGHPLRRVGACLRCEYCGNSTGCR
jgi:hypothetical protein